MIPNDSFNTNAAPVNMTLDKPLIVTNFSGPKCVILSGILCFSDTEDRHGRRWGWGNWGLNCDNLRALLVRCNARIAELQGKT